MNKDTGGPAFPVTFKQLVAHDGEGRPIYCEDTYGGMTLRDYFAAKAMAALIGNELDCTIDTLAKRSYVVADAMLEARK